MASETTYANLDSHEGTVTTSATVTLARKSRKLIITNDSGSVDLQYKFNTSESWATLKPTETISLEFITKTIYLSASSAPYRIWSFG